jgi:hypothetical protein
MKSTTSTGAQSSTALKRRPFGAAASLGIPSQT